MVRGLSNCKQRCPRHARIQKVLPEGSNFAKVFSDGVERIKIPLVEMVFRWRADDGLTLNLDLEALCFFPGDPETLYFCDF